MHDEATAPVQNAMSQTDAAALALRELGESQDQSPATAASLSDALRQAIDRDGSEIAAIALAHLCSP